MSWLTRLFPPRCLLCGDPGAAGRALCAGCQGDLPALGHACARCAEPLPGTAAGRPELSVCGACLWRPPPYTSIDVAFPYAAPIDWLVRRLKFRGDLPAGQLLGDLLSEALAERVSGVEAVVPVPLHPARLRARGFNQVSEIARPLARRLDAPLMPGGLRRRRPTVPQMELPADRRRGNVRHAFAPGGEPVCGRVLLIDDVVTTASTVREAARALTSAGAEAVHVVAVARA